MSNYLSRLKSDLRVAPKGVPYNLRVVKARDLNDLISNFERLEQEYRQYIEIGFAVANSMEELQNGHYFRFRDHAAAVAFSCPEDFPDTVIFPLFRR